MTNIEIAKWTAGIACNRLELMNCPDVRRQAHRMLPSDSLEPKACQATSQPALATTGATARLAHPVEVELVAAERVQVLAHQRRRQRQRGVVDHRPSADQLDQGLLTCERRG